jgi:hypothetical protein
MPERTEVLMGMVALKHREVLLGEQKDQQTLSQHRRHRIDSHIQRTLDSLKLDVRTVEF